MLTILIWLGSGFAFAVGVLVGAWLCRLSSPHADTDRQIAKESLTALRERNCIGRDQCEMLDRIAGCLEERNK